MKNEKHAKHMLTMFLKHTRWDDWLYKLSDHRCGILYSILEEQIKEFEKDDEK